MHAIFSPSFPLNLIGTLQALLLLLVANGAPILASKVLGKRCSWPIDAGYCMADGRRWLGKTKTWRGLVSAACLTAVCTALMNGDFWLGFGFGGLCMIGDFISSFIKRRLARPESSHCKGLDTIPETLLPLLVYQNTLEIGFVETGLIVGVFFLIEEYVSPVLFQLHLRNRPY